MFDQFGYTVVKHGSNKIFGQRLPGIQTVTDDFNLGDLCPTTPSANREKIEEITWRLRNPAKFKALMFKIWYKDHKKSARLDADEVRDFLEKVEAQKGIPVSRFGDIEEAVFVYDFNGDGYLGFSETLRMIRHELVMWRRELGGAKDLDARTETPQQAGYTIVRQLGAGGQGIAFLATDADGEQKCLKAIDMNTMNPGSWDEIQLEILSMRKVQSDRVAQCYDFFQSNNQFYMVSEAYLGGDLAALQQNARAQGVDLDEDWYRCVFRQCFEALEVLHKKAVIHADIKEPNIMLRTNDYANPDVVLIDLGLAKTIKGPAKDAPSGTPGYMPPEVFTYRKWYPTGDVFSMGVVVCDMLMNCVPTGTSPYGLFQKNFPTGGLPAIERDTCSVEPDYGLISEDLGDVQSWLEGCMEKDQTQRWPPKQVLQDPWFRGAGLCTIA